MTDQPAPGVVVWSRDIDETASRRRRNKFGQWFAAPAAAAAILALVLGGFGAMLGVLILLGGIGAMLALWVWTYDRGLRAHPTIQLVDGRLMHHKASVFVADIEAWTTLRSTGASAGVGGISVHGAAANVIFRIPVLRNGVRGVRPDGGPAFERVYFGWPEMSTAELEGVRVALAPHIDVQWSSVEQLGN